MKLGNVQLWTTLKQLVHEVQSDDVAGLSAELAYRFFLALFPFFLFLAALGGLVAGFLDIANPAQRLVDLISDQLPADAARLLEDQLTAVIGTQRPGLVSVGILGAIWAASSGFKAVMKAMNRAYDVEETRPFITKNLVGVGLTLLAGTFVVGAFVLVVAGEFLGGESSCCCCGSTSRRSSCSSGPNSTLSWTSRPTPIRSRPSGKTSRPRPSGGGGGLGRVRGASRSSMARNRAHGSHRRTRRACLHLARRPRPCVGRASGRVCSVLRWVGSSLPSTSVGTSVGSVGADGRRSAEGSYSALCVTMTTKEGAGRKSRNTP